MTHITARLRTAMFLAGALLLSNASYTRSDFDQEWLVALHEEARALFFQTVREATVAHPERGRQCNDRRGTQRRVRRSATYMEETDTYIPSISAAIPTVASQIALVASVYPPLGTEVLGEYAQTLIDLVTETANPEAVGQEGFSAEAGHGLIDAAREVERAVELQQTRSR